MSDVQIYVSFDLDHDRDLYDRLLEQSEDAFLGFEVASRSEVSTKDDLENSELRGRIRDADQMIVICGEHTDASVRVFAELRIAQEEQKPYFLLWGRRDTMCTKPVGAKSQDGMYGWTPQILQDQISVTTRNAEWKASGGGKKSQPKS